MHKLIAKTLHTLRSLVRREQMDAELDEELAFHLEREADELTRRGMSRDDAMREARRRFGGVQNHREASRDVRHSSWLTDLAADLRFAVRHFARHRLATVTTMIVLAVGISANAAVFTVVRSVIASPVVGLTDDDRLVRIRTEQENTEWHSWNLGNVAPDLFDAYRASDAFQGMAGQTSPARVIVDAHDAERAADVSALFVTSEYFDVLGIPAAHGPGFTRTPVGAVEVVISDALWHRRFASRADIAGTTVRVNRILATIVGVAPPRFVGLASVRPALLSDSPTRLFAVPAPPVDLLFVSEARGAVLTPEAARDRDRYAIVAARLAGDTPIEHAGTVATTIAARHPEEGRRSRADVVPLRASNGDPRADAEIKVFGAMWAAPTLLLLLIVCSNVGSLTIGRSLARGREIAVRLSMGASRWRVVRQLLTESIALSLASGALAALLLIALATFGRHLIPGIELGFDWASASTTMVVALLTGLIFGQAPALHASRTSVGDVLKSASNASSGSAATSRRQRSFVVLQVALTQPLLIGLAVAGLKLYADRSTAFDAVGDRVALLSVASRAGDSASRANEIKEAMRRIASLPGVVSVSDQSAVRIDINSAQGFLPVAGDQLASPAASAGFPAEIEYVSAGYFSTFELPIVRGREFVEDDMLNSAAFCSQRGSITVQSEGPLAAGLDDCSASRAKRRGIIIGSDAARLMWGDANPVGRSLRYWMDSPDRIVETVTVVGVVDSAAVPRVGRSPTRAFRPRPRGPALGMEILVKTVDPAKGHLADVRRAVRQTPMMSLLRLTTVGEIRREDERHRLQLTGAAAAAGAIALILASLGLYAAVAVATGLRRREIGIRAALGAGSGQLTRSFFLSGIRLGGIGMLLGLPLSALAVRWLASVDGEFRFANAELTSAGIGLLVLGVTAIATWLPARRVAKVNPIEALRND